MKTVKILEESNRYEGGKRVNVKTVETVTMLSDDLATLAGYHSALAGHQEMLEKLVQAVPVDEAQTAEIVRETERIRQEMRILRDAIQIQERHIRGFEDGD